jgi:hypothetical protein
MGKRKRESQDWKPDPGVLDLFAFAEEVKKLAVKVEGIVNDLRDFGFDAGVACIDHPPNVPAVRVRLQVEGIWGPAGPWKWDRGPGKLSARHWDEIRCMMEQVEGMQDHFLRNYGIAIAVMAYGGSMILSTPTISARRIGGKVREAKRG